MNFRTFFVAILLVCLSCVAAREMGDDNTQDKEETTSKIYVAASSDLLDVEWKKGDVLALCSSKGADKFTVDLNDRANGAVAFNGLSSASSARVIYPYDGSAFSGGNYSFDIESQNYDFDAPLSSLGDAIPLVSGDMVDLEQEKPSASMMYIGAALKVSLEFTGLESGVNYVVENVTFHNLPTKASFSIADDPSSKDFMRYTTGDISLDVANSPRVEEGQKYIVYASIIPFVLAADGVIDFSVTIKSIAGGEQISIVKDFSFANNQGGAMDFSRDKFHALSVVCPLEQSATVRTTTMDGSELSSYTTDEVAIDVDGVSLAVCNVGNYSNYGTPPIQFKKAVGYLYNLTALNGLSEVAIKYLSTKKCIPTLYVGTECKPIKTEVEAVETSNDSYTTLTYAIPDGATHIAIYNHSTYAAYANTITFTYKSTGVTGSLAGGGDDPAAESPYSTSNAPRWGEIPEYDGNANYQYVTHTATLNNSTVRNYSLCFDRKSRAAAWVAYPFHECYTGDVDRTDDWGFDPYISEALQADLDSSYDEYNGVSYHRGHQISSADRLATHEMNSQTFYYSNMTPQNGSLNSGQWASLEEKVRDQVCADTLYVVTGADFKNIKGTTTDDGGNKCPIPGAFYKVLLRTKAGNSGKAVSECSAGELQAIGYWVENIYTGALPKPVSVSEIEAKTGFNFFPSIPETVKESYDTSLWKDL